MDWRHPGDPFKLNPNSSPVYPIDDIGVALFGGPFCTGEWPDSASAEILFWRVFFTRTDIHGACHRARVRASR
jgi:hypothetical protein